MQNDNLRSQIQRLQLLWEYLRVFHEVTICQKGIYSLLIDREGWLVFRQNSIIYDEQPLSLLPTDQIGLREVDQALQLTGCTERDVIKKMQQIWLDRPWPIQCYYFIYGVIWHMACIARSRRDDRAYRLEHQK